MSDCISLKLALECHHLQAAVHPNAATFELVRVFDHILLYKYKFHFSSSSRVITMKQAHPPTNRH